MIGILGGGLTGLTLGSLIDDSEVLEKEAECGGLCRSLKEDGFTFDWGGSHIIFTRKPKVLEFIHELLGDNLSHKKRNSKIFYKKKLIKYPFENGLYGLDVKDRFECVRDYVLREIARASGEKSNPKNFKEWVYARFGAAIAEKYMIPYNEKIWNIDTKDLSFDWIDSRVPQPPIEDILRSATGVESEGYSENLWFEYPITGGIEAIISGLKSRNKNLSCGFDVKNIRKTKDGFDVSDGKTTKKYSKLISTIPLTDLAEMIGEPELGQKLRFTSVITVLLGLNDCNPTDVSWMYFPSILDGKFNRISFPFSFSEKTAPQGKKSILVEITCNHNDDVWKTDNETLIQETISDLSNTGIIKKSDIIYSKAMRSKHAYVVYTTKHANAVAALREKAAELGIILCGRFGEFEYFNMDASIARAMEVANLVNSSDFKM